MWETYKLSVDACKTTSPVTSGQKPGTGVNILQKQLSKLFFNAKRCA